ncbi:hypothetical protein SAMN05192533_11222 [Mesobacillus persicus]|uniref:SH3 domain-containing protein n=1 Tax=Mesobacillus persicus TaxID=930146 RepID=A0A1H8FZT3_9BACI|nr:hypothetical protein [Mesobacillus persicus]SEN37034.1 hypothetical protein SAMN05192533_11222 [Mesobacillus persicus]
MKKILFFFITIVFLAIAGCSQEVGQQADELGAEIEETGEVIEAETEQVVENMNQEIDQTVEDFDQVIVAEGEEAVIERDILFPVNEEAYDQLFAYLEQPEYTKIEDMREADKVMYVEKDTKVDVLDVDVIKSKVSIQSNGQEGYIPTEFLEQVSSS